LDRTDTMLAYPPGANGLITARVWLMEKSLQVGPKLDTLGLAL
jgi:hypothetical protein